MGALPREASLPLSSALITRKERRKGYLLLSSHIFLPAQGSHFQAFPRGWVLIAATSRAHSFSYSPYSPQYAQYCGIKHSAQESPEGRVLIVATLHTPPSRQSLDVIAQGSNIWAVPRGWDIHCSHITFPVSDPLETVSVSLNQFSPKENWVQDRLQQVPHLRGEAGVCDAHCSHITGPK